MITTLFWNTQHKPVDRHLERLVNSNKADIVLLAESMYTKDDLLQLVNSSLPPTIDTFYALPAGKEPRVQAISRLTQWQLEFERPRYLGWSFTASSGRRILMVAVHFNPILYEADEQRNTAISLREDIDNYEDVFVVGDFNANPFDAGICGFYGLNASQSRELVLRLQTRTIEDRKRRFLYNPMWRFLGTSVAEGVSGTYYNRLPSPVSYDWFILDQLLLTPSLISSFEDDIQILTQDANPEMGGLSLVNPKSGIPRDRISDHLPIVFKLNV